MKLDADHQPEQRCIGGDGLHDQRYPDPKVCGDRDHAQGTTRDNYRADQDHHAFHLPLRRREG